MNTNPNAKRIMIWGDSLTWGRIAGHSERHDSKTRYTGVLQDILGNEYEVIEEGLRGRMAYGENPGMPHRDGFAVFPGIFLSHLPVDLLIIFLGTNDNKTDVNKNSQQIASELEKYIEVVKRLSISWSFNTPKVLFVVPPTAKDAWLKGDTTFVGAEEKMRSLSAEIAAMATRNKCRFFDSNEFISVCEEDGIHLNVEANKVLGENLAKFIKENLL